MRHDFRNVGEDGADLHLAHGVVVEFARGRNGWEVWGVRIDGKLYREPRDLEGEPLQPGSMLGALSRLDLEPAR